jgi:hypothetical protein
MVEKLPSPYEIQLPEEEIEDRHYNFKSRARLHATQPPKDTPGKKKYREQEVSEKETNEKIKTKVGSTKGESSNKRDKDNNPKPKNYKKRNPYSSRY